MSKRLRLRESPISSNKNILVLKNRKYFRISKSKILSGNYKFGKNRNFDQKIEIWAKKLCSKIKILLKYQSKFCSKIQTLLKNENFAQKLKFYSKMKMLLKNPNFAQKSKFCSKIQILLKN